MGQGSASPTPTGHAQQRASAEALYNCLDQAGVPVSLQDLADGQSAFAFKDEGAAILWSRPGGGFGYVGEVPTEQIDALQVSGQTGYYLTVNGVDYSAKYQECFESSGYTEPEFSGEASDPDVDAWYRRMVEVSNDWAACARDHGFPHVADTGPYDPLAGKAPMVLLPADITADQLLALIEVCPLYNEDDVRAMWAARLAAAMECDDEGLSLSLDGLTPPASVGFDYPGFDGQADEPLDDLDMAEVDRLNALVALASQEGDELLARLEAEAIEQYGENPCGD
ncbi:MAG: hypothetical protein LBR19_09765 [Bifidobacteriaceae bacterium]|nr:hypothetical protein [Bifidobacteriaceae bacterium]